MGIWSRFDVFVPLYVTICHVHTHIYVYVDVQISVYMCIYTHIYIYMCGKANCVAFIAICTLFRAYGPLGRFRAHLYEYMTKFVVMSFVSVNWRHHPLVHLLEGR